MPCVTDCVTKIVWSLRDHSIGIKCGLGNHKIGNLNILYEAKWKNHQEVLTQNQIPVSSKYFILHFTERCTTLSKITFLVLRQDFLVTPRQSKLAKIKNITFTLSPFFFLYLKMLQCFRIILQKIGLNWPISFCDERSGITFISF